MRASRGRRRSTGLEALFAVGILLVSTKPAEFVSLASLRLLEVGLPREGPEGILCI